MASPRRSIATWKKLLFSAVVCVAFFAVLELVMWLAGAPTLLEVEDPWQGFSSLISVYERDGDVYRTRRFKDHWTFNKQSFVAEKRANGLRIFCLGGSSSYGYPWGADVAFTAILGDLLDAAHPASHVEAINASGVSYGIHRLRILIPELLRYEPDVFVIYSGHNEFIEPTFYRQLKDASPQRHRWEYALAKSRTYAALRRTLSIDQQVSEQSGFDGPEFDLLALRDESVTYDEQQKHQIVSQFQRTLRDIVQIAHENDVRVILATLPCNMRWRPHRSIVGAQVTGTTRRRWERALQAGKQALEAGDAQAALSHLESALQLSPGHAETHFLRARAFEQLERWGPARDSYRQACDDDASPQRRISAINAAIKNVAREENALLVDMNQVFEDHSEHGVVSYDLIEDYVHPSLKGHQQIAGKLWEAIEQAGWFGSPNNADPELLKHVVATRDLESTPRNARWFCNQAVVLVHQERIAQAISVLEEAAELFPTDANVHWRLASLLVSQNDLDGAIRHYEQALKLDPSSAGGWMNLGVVYERRGNLTQAEEHLRRAIDIDPTNAMAHYNLGVVLEKRAQLDDARAHFAAALELQPDFHEAYARLAKLSQRQ